MYPLIDLKYFYPRPPRGGRLTANFPLFVIIRFLSTPSARRATEIIIGVPNRKVISIHALREEGDSLRFLLSSPTLPFLSTPSARRATYISVYPNVMINDFYPRPPRGGRPAARSCLPLTTIFLSTPSARRATRVPCGIMATVFYFYPRPPRGGRPFSLGIFPPVSIFLSTPSARRATRARARGYKSGVFLSTPSARRATTARRRSSTDWRLFLSTPSARRATTRLLRH